MLLGLIVLLFLMRLGTARRPQAPDLAADCAKPAFALSATSVRQGAPVSFTIVGRAGRTYALGFDVRSFERSADGRWVPVPPVAEGSLVAAAPEPMPADCSRTGYFAVPVPPGTHTVSLYELHALGPLFVAQQKITVTAG